MHLITQWRYVAFLVTLLVSSPVAAVYITAMDQAAWHFKKTKTSCQIEHKIDEVALARFSSHFGGTLLLELDWLNKSPQGGPATLSIIPAPWQNLDAHILGQGVWQQQSVRFSESSSPALEALASGHWLSINEPGRKQGFVLTSIHFQQPYNAFRLCRGDTGVEQTLDGQQLTLHFPVGAHRLSRAQIRQLTILSQKISGNSQVSGLLIESFTDNSGTPQINLRLSRERGEQVVEQLRRTLLQLPMDMNAHGQAFPLNDNSTPAARYQNRRVTITLLKVEQAS